LDGDGFGARSRWGAGGARALQSQHLVGRERVRARAEQLARLRVEEQQRGRFDPDRDLASAEDLGGEQLAAAEADQAGVVDGAVDLDRAAGPARDDRQRRRAGGCRAVALELREVGTGEVRAQALDAGAGDREVDDVDAGPEPDCLPSPDRAEPELALGDHRVP
jgi:hypothetical protein